MFPSSPLYWTMPKSPSGLILGPDGIIIAAFKETLAKQFEITDQGIAADFLGIQILYTEEGIALSQFKYIKKVLHRFGPEYLKPATTPFNEKVVA